MGRDTLIPQEKIDSLAWKIHDWFTRHPLGTTDEGYDHFKAYFETLMEDYSLGDYSNYN